MSKCSIEDVRIAMKSAGVEQIKIEATVAEVEKIVEASKNDAPRKKTKNKILVLGSIEVEGQKFTETPAWAFKVAEEFDHTTLEAKLRSAITAFKSAKPKKAALVATFGLALQRIPRRFFKDVGIQVITKDPILMQEVDNRHA